MHTDCVEEEVTGGEVKLTVKLGFITVQTYEYEVCEIVTGGCPVQGMYVACMYVYSTQCMWWYSQFRHGSLQTFLLSC